MTHDVFLSVGKFATPDQEAFIEAVEQILRDNGLVPRRAEFSSIQPLRKIEEIMAECEGTVIIAFERLNFPKGLELRGGEFEVELENITLPTVWNQVEAAMAYTFRHPLLVICERSLRAEGLLEKGFDWYIQPIDINEAEVNSREFRGIFDDWKQRVEKHQRKDIENSYVNFENITIGQFIKSLGPTQAWSILTAIVGSLSAIAGFAFFLGSRL